MNVKVAGKSATVAWSPLQERPGLLAAATVAGADAFSAPSVRRASALPCPGLSLSSPLPFSLSVSVSLFLSLSLSFSSPALFRRWLLPRSLWGRCGFSGLHSAISRLAGRCFLSAIGVQPWSVLAALLPEPIGLGLSGCVYLPDCGSRADS